MSQIINPFCEQCGGVTERWKRLNRRHAGFSFHRVCCCKKGCPTLEITLSGFNASLCTGCNTSALSSTMSNRYTSIGSVDGTYSLDFFEGTNCSYVTCVPVPNVLTWNTYEPDDCSTVLASDSAQAFQIHVGYNPTDQTITECIIYAMADSECSTNATDFRGNHIQFMRETGGLGSAVPVSLGESIPNTADCAISRPTDGGFAIVDNA